MIYYKFLEIYIKIYLKKIEKFQDYNEYLEFPDFLKSFVQSQLLNWCNNTFEAKNYMNKEIDYIVREDNNDIAPIDRFNTGETQIFTFYDKGLHQILEIKEKLKIKDETLTDAFLSNITFFQKYKNEEKFLFFGLTGTIGDYETQKIYQNQYFNSKLLFIPHYKRKRFIQFPIIISEASEHMNRICKEIFINYYKGRKILVICESIREAKVILKVLLHYNIDCLQREYPNLKEDYKEDILLYTRSDNLEKTNLRKNKKIILSTNLGGRGTDIRTSFEEEKNGGLHVILTNMPNNYRVLKQALGRTSREGKKGTCQIILKKTEFNSYSEYLKEMNRKEMERFNDIQK